MGRARGSHLAVATDNFSSVLGARRGPMEADTLLAATPSASAHAELRRLVAQPGFAETEEALRMLGRHRALISQRPLLSTLADSLAERSARAALGTWSPQVKELLAVAGLRDEFSDQLFSDSNDQVHVCENGGDYRVDDELHTACGIPLTRSDVQRARRGTWKRAASAGLRRCTACSEHAPAIADAEESGTETLGAAAETRLSTALAARVRERMQRAWETGQPVDEHSLETFAGREVPQTLQDFVTDAVHRGGPAVLARALGRQNWKVLKDALGADALDPVEVWPRDEWEDWLMGFAPREKLRLSPDQVRERRERARSLLFNQLCADLGVKKRR